MTVQLYSSCRHSKLLHLEFIWCFPHGQTEGMGSGEEGKVPFLMYHVMDPESQESKRCEYLARWLR